MSKQLKELKNIVKELDTRIVKTVEEINDLEIAKEKIQKLKTLNQKVKSDVAEYNNIHEQITSDADYLYL
jgi:hypothetical protein